MLHEESVWIKRQLDGLKSVKEVLDVGSSTRHFRTVTQPYIDANVFKPLRDRGVRVSYLDQKGGDDIDYAADVESLKPEQIGKYFDLVLCCSLLEHVHQPKKAAASITSLIKPGGYLLITVPRAYRHHGDPIDTMFRPTTEELVAMFPDMEKVSQETITISDLRTYDLLNPMELIRYVIVPLRWKVSCAIMKKGT
jgi:SAM-dependent methyltransferase